uniref:Uncharacterized protein n=1 Tax=uncultured bacterium EB3 TaxID=1348856 RepID=U3NGC7_9BACT|nr:hypothetical protein [uncultured bacterium EB3]
MSSSFAQKGPKPAINRRYIGKDSLSPPSLHARPLAENTAILHEKFSMMNNLSGIATRGVDVPAGIALQSI